MKGTLGKILGSSYLDCVALVDDGILVDHDDIVYEMFNVIETEFVSKLVRK